MTSQPVFPAAGAYQRRRGRITSPGPKRSAGVPGRTLALLSGLAAALVAAFVSVPRLVAASTRGGGFSDQRSLIASLRDAFVGYWGSDSRSFAPPMQRVVDYWFRYHVAKAVTAALLLWVLIALAVLLCRTYLRAEIGGRGRAAVASGGALAAMLALSAAAVVAANIQGAVAPLASLLSMLPAAKPDGRFTTTLDQVRQGLAHYSSAGSRTSPTLKGMVDDFALYHAALAVVATIVVVVLLGLGVAACRSFVRTAGDRRARRTFAVFALASIATSLAVVVIAAANVSTAAHPAPALLAFFQGGS